ncbi:uncharacterized protein LOC143470518 isoform X2 [Clavelina lepadiformis]|uniref:uncharacterized protein LOC143470518 isoform X2 n=1 Tax=Clavelina lepadiformis TaxID=159417 RepID=UPI004041D0E4
MASQQGHWITNRHLYENPNEYDDVINVNPNVVERIQSSSTTSQHKLNSKMDTWKFVSGLALLMSFISVGVACAALLVVTKSLEQPDFLRQGNKDKNWESMQKANNKSGCSRGFIFNNTCIFLPPLEVLANYSQAANVCALADAELVKITNEKMFEAVCDGILKMRLEKSNPVNNPGHLITVTED